MKYGERAFAIIKAVENTYRLAGALNKTGQAKRAEKILLDMIEKMKGVTCNNSYVLSLYQSELGESLSQQQRFAEAETLLLSADQTQKAVVLPSEYKRSETRQHLAEFYRAWNKPDDVKKYGTGSGTPN